MEYVLWFWRSYPVAVDMALYFFVFAAAARVAFAKTFPGHEGKLLSIAVGLLLAVGLAIAQRTLGFSTESLGPVAVFLLCGVVFLAAYNVIARSGVSKPLAVLLSALLGLALARYTPAMAGRHASNKVNNDREHAERALRHGRSPIYTTRLAETQNPAQYACTVKRALAQTHIQGLTPRYPTYC